MAGRLAIFLTFLLLWTGAAEAQNAAAIVQQIHDGAYADCMNKGQFGAGTELQENCSCSADVVMNLLADDFKHAIADGTQASFKGPKLKVGAAGFNATLVKTCPKIGAYLPQ
jgi:hypothetical protein